MRDLVGDVFDFGHTNEYSPEEVICPAGLDLAGGWRAAP
jgi:hypothetical protein